MLQSLLLNPWVSHDFHKPIACLIIKILMIGNRNFIFRFGMGALLLWYIYIDQGTTLIPRGPVFCHIVIPI